MILFHPIIMKLYVGKAIRPVHDLAAQYPADGTWVGYVTVGSHSLWSMTHHIFGLLEEPLRRHHVSPL